MKKFVLVIDVRSDEQAENLARSVNDKGLDISDVTDIIGDAMEEYPFKAFTETNLTEAFGE